MKTSMFHTLLVKDDLEEAKHWFNKQFLPKHDLVDLNAKTSVAVSSIGVTNATVPAASDGTGGSFFKRLKHAPE